MKISELVKDTGCISIEGIDRDIKEMSYNTGTVTDGCLFFCIVGYKTDGHLYAKKAVENGARAIVISRDVEVGNDITKIYVKDTRIAMARMASNFYGNPASKLNVIGVTGTNGKTTSTFMLKSILDTAGHKTALLGTIYNIIGDKTENAKRTTPESLDLQKMFYEMVSDGIDTCIMEVSSHSLALKRVFGVNFKTCIFTNLTQDHLDFHKTMENYFKTKLTIFDNCDTACINVDDEYGRRAASTISNRQINYGITNKCDVMAKDIKIREDGTEFTLSYKNNDIQVDIHMPGKFNVYNALGCAASCISLGISPDKIKDGLEVLTGVPGRSEIINAKNGFTIVIDYAHTPDGIVNILKTAREYTKGSLITVFGCGGDRDKTKRPKMGKAAGELSDFCVVTSDNPRSEDPKSIIEDILPGIEETNCNYIIIADRVDAIKYAIKKGKIGDVIVIAGKGHETYQILKDKTIHFDEREIVSAILKEEN